MSSPFSKRLSVASSRPVVAGATVDATEVIPVPTEGRPADYRGAVGQYNIVTQASPVNVHAGDSITLNLGIVGTGPMELVQAPPLSELPELKEFKVSNQPLAGYVKDDSKVFSTTIRPRQAGITEIPAIPFSFFNPETEQFETVRSSLALDSIVGAKSTNSKQQNATQNAISLTPSFINFDAPSVLISQQPQSAWNWWWLAVVVPPVMWVITLITRYRHWIAEHLPSLRSPQARCSTQISNAKDQSVIAHALLRYMQKKFPARKSAAVAENLDETSSTIGAMRAAGFYELAAEAEALLEQLSHSNINYGAPVDLEEQRSTALDFLSRLSDQINSQSSRRIRRSQKSKDKLKKHARFSQPAAMLLGLVLASAASTAMANDITATGLSPEPHVQLDQSQREVILNDASESYRNGLSLAETNAADAKDLFLRAAKKSTGSRNCELRPGIEVGAGQSPVSGESQRSTRHGENSRYAAKTLWS